MKISVCLATYNGAKYLKEQVDSILVQLTIDDELVVSDDYSTDSTVDILKSYNDSRIKIYFNSIRKGVVGNFENAISNAKGDIIILSDQDDIWLPNKVKTCIEGLQSYDLVITDCRVVDSNLNVIHNSFFKILNSGKGFWKNFRHNTYIGACIAFKRDCLRYILPFPNALPVFHDSWIASLVEIKGSVSFIPECCMLYRRHGNNASMTSTKSSLPLWMQFKYRLHFLYLILLRLLRK